jgi:ribonuclease HI
MNFTVALNFIPELKKFQNLKRADWTQFKSILEGHPIPPIPQSCDDLDVQACDIGQLITQTTDFVCPWREDKGRSNPWHTKELRYAKAQLSAIRKLAAKHPHLIPEAKAQETAYRGLLRRTKNQSWRDFCSEMDCLGPAAKKIKALKKRDGHREIGIIRNQTGDWTETPSQTVQTLVDVHFPDSKPTEIGLLPRISATNSPFIDFVTEERIIEAFESFAPMKSPGQDGIRAIQLKKVPPNLIKWFRNIFIASINLGYPPRCWRQIKAVFIPKPGKEDYDTAKSFRPISLSSFILKALERIIYWWLKSNILLDPLPNQHAFTPNRSCDTALSTLVDKIESAVHRRKYILVVSLDIAGAFDNIGFDCLNQGFINHNCDPAISEWYNYLGRNREVTTSIKGTTLTFQPGKGTMQGDILSPPGWGLGINDTGPITANSPVELDKYADDLILTIIGIDPQAMMELMQGALNRAVKWADPKGLSFAPAKTQVMLSTNKRKFSLPKCLALYGTELPFLDEITYLGITIDKKLTWTNHINRRIAKCKKLLFTAKNAVGRDWGLKPHVARWIITAIVRPTLSYGAHVWCPQKWPKTTIRSLYSLQRLGLAMMFSPMKSTPTRSMEILAGLEPLHIYLEKQAVLSHNRLQNYINSFRPKWDGTTDVIRVGHRLHWSNLLKEIVPEGTPTAHISSSMLWNRNFAYSLEEHGKLVPGLAKQENTVLVYTDGSLIDGYAGSGWLITKGDFVLHENHLSLGNDTTVFQAEVAAMLHATEWLLANFWSLDRTKIFILVDNQAAIRAVSHRSFKDGLVLECRNKINSLSFQNDVTLGWIRGHAESCGNEVADSLAKSGSLTPLDHPVLPMAKRTIERKIADKYLTRWQHEWEETKEHVHSKSFLFDVRDEAYKTIKRLPKQRLRRLCAFVTGHVNLRYFVKKFDPTISPWCRWCDEELEKPLHIADDCPRFAQARLLWWTGRPPDTANDTTRRISFCLKILSEPEIVKALETWLSTEAADSP